MWNSQFNKYIFNTGARSYEPPNSGYDLTRLNDIKNYFSVAGYQSGSVGYINANESNFIPPYINLSKGDALIIPDNLPNLSFDLYFDGFYKTQSETNLNYEVCLLYFDSDMGFLGQSSSFPIVNGDNNIDIEVRANGFQYPASTKYVHIGFKNNNSESLKIVYNYSSLSVKISEEQKHESLLKTVENPLFVLVGGLGGTPAPQPIPDDLTLNNLTLNNSFTMKNGNNSGVMVLNQDGDFQINSGNINMYNKKVTNLAYPSSAQDAVSKNYVDNAIMNIPKPNLSEYLKNSGSNSYTGDLTLSGNLILPLEDKITMGQNNFIETMSNNDLVLTKGGVHYLALSDSEIYTSLPINLNQNKITNVLNPVDSQDVATKSYVDSKTEGGNNGPTNLTSSTLKLDYVQGEAPDDSQNCISFYNKNIIGFPMFQVGFNTHSDNTFQVFANNQLYVGCNQNAIQFVRGDNGSGGSISIISNEPAQFVGYAGVKQSIDIKQATVEDLPTADNMIATKKYVDDSAGIPKAIFGQFQAFRTLSTSFNANPSGQEFMNISFTNGPVPNVNQKLMFSVNLSQFALSNCLSFDISYKVNNEAEVTFFSRTEDTNVSKYSTPLSVSGLINTVAYPINISFKFYNYYGSPVSIQTLPGVPVSAKLEAVNTNSSVFSIGL